MAGTYRVTPFRRAVDRLMARLARLGITPGGIAALTVVGRVSGEERTVPVTPLRLDGREYLVAPYGSTGWVHNLRAAGTATLRQGRRSSPIAATEVSAAEAAPVLKRYVEKTPLVRPHVAAAPEASLAEFEVAAAQHPVFLVRRLG